MMRFLIGILAISVLVNGCTSNVSTDTGRENGVNKTTQITEVSSASGVTAVSINESSEGNYTFSVTVASEETGCDRYANWWEVITEDGTLLYRRILAHSHVDEQPFTRSGGPVEIEADEVVIVRSHMYPTGYHTQAIQGSFTKGFESVTLPADFATELAEVEPLPTGCTF
ncbi:MAG: hypothetical protein AAGJ95_03120 [Cyanobacteria bacterium J06554_11]